MQQDVPGYALISGGKKNGLYTRDGQYYRLSDGKMFNVESGAASVTDGGDKQSEDPREAAEAHLAAMKAEAAGKAEPKAEKKDEKAPEPKDEPKAEKAKEKDAPEADEKPKAKRKASDVAVIADGLIADSSAKELYALASSLAKELKSEGKTVSFEPNKGEDGKRANAEFIAKNGK